jgi:hypothetical protein
MCYELRCAFARLFFAGPVRLTRLPCSALLVAGLCVLFVFRPGHELCRVMSALLRALQCCVLRPVVLPVALVGGVTYCPAVSLLRSAVCELVALCGVSSCPGLLCPALTCVLCYAILFQRGFYWVFLFMHRGMCEALFGVPVFRPGCEICRVMFALR